MLPHPIQKKLVRQDVVNILSDSISANAILLIKQTERKRIKWEYLKNIIKNTRLIILNTVILATLQAFAKDFSAEGYTSKLIDRLGEKKR